MVNSKIKKKMKEMMKWKIKQKKRDNSEITILCNCQLFINTHLSFSIDDHF